MASDKIYLKNNKQLKSNLIWSLYDTMQYSDVVFLI